jgi:hypothetical protein
MAETIARRMVVVLDVVGVKERDLLVQKDSQLPKRYAKVEARATVYVQENMSIQRE